MGEGLGLGLEAGAGMGRRAIEGIYSALPGPWPEPFLSQVSRCQVSVFPNTGSQAPIEDLLPVLKHKAPLCSGHTRGLPAGYRHLRPWRQGS